MNASQPSAMKNIENQNEWAKTSLQNFDRVIENLIKKNASLEERIKELELDFTILCIALSIACIITVLIVYLF